VRDFGLSSVGSISRPYRGGLIGGLANEIGNALGLGRLGFGELDRLEGPRPIVFGFGGPELVGEQGINDSIVFEGGKPSFNIRWTAFGKEMSCWEGLSANSRSISVASFGRLSRSRT